MLDLTRLRNDEITLAELTADLTPTDLRDLTNEMVDRQLAIIAGATDADVVFQPLDPDAHDSYAASAEEEGIAWTLGHVVVHATASSEESAFRAAELARGVLREGRSRYETPWETVTTIQQCRERLEQSRRMRLATLDVWPDQPHYEVAFESRSVGKVNANTRFVLGLLHDMDHLGQLEDVVAQAVAAREGVSA